MRKNTEQAPEVIGHVDEIGKRAIAAYLRRAKRSSSRDPDMPAASSTTVEKDGDGFLVTLHNTNGVLARLRTSDGARFAFLDATDDE